MTELEQSFLLSLSDVPHATIGDGFGNAVERLPALGLIEPVGDQWRITAAGRASVAADYGATVH